MGITGGTRNSLLRFCCLAKNVLGLSLPTVGSLPCHMCIQRQSYQVMASFVLSVDSALLSRSNMYQYQTLLRNLPPTRCMSRTSFELNTDNGVVRFSIGKPLDETGSLTQGKKVAKRVKMSKKAKLNELRFYRLKAKKKINSPNPEVRITYKLEKAKRKEAWLIEKLRKFQVHKASAETHDPEILTEEEKHYLKRTGEKKKNYVPVGRRGVFGGVVLNMHLHWKKHETVKVICKPCKPGQVHEYADELARLSKGIVIDIKPNNTIIFYRGKNYVQPEVMSPPDTLSKNKALEKYRFEQSLEHTGQFIEKLEKELEEYHQHLARFKKVKEDTTQDCLIYR
ncbi:putative CRM domain-containing protein [Rosa sericea]